MQPIRVSIEETEQPIRNREILKFCALSMREFSLDGIQQGDPKQRIQKKIKSHTADTEIWQSELGESNIRVFNAGQTE